MEPIGGLGPIEGGKEESALDELLLAQMTTEAHCLPNEWVRDTAQGGAKAFSLKDEFFAMQVYTMVVRNTKTGAYVETDVAESPEEALEWAEGQIRDVYGATPVSNYEEENIADRGEGGFHVKEKDGSILVHCQSHKL